MTWAEFVAEIKQLAWPDREASNLVANHTRYILDGLIELQKRIPQLRDRNFNLFDFAQTFYRCRATLITKPDGPLLRLYTYTQDAHCDTVFYHPTTREHMESLLANPCITYAPPIGPTVGPPPEDVFVAQAVTDKGRRALSGHYAVIGKQVYVWPHIESEEKLFLEWSGIKTSYQPQDEVDFNSDVMAVIELYVQAQAALREDCDMNRYAALQSAWLTRSAELAWWYRTKDLLPESPWREQDQCVCPVTVTTEGGGGGTAPPPSGSFLVYIGNAGSDFTPPASYSAEFIKGMDNTFPNPSTRSFLPGNYEISRPASNLNEWKLICIPAAVWSGPVNFTNSGFNFPMTELPDKVDIDAQPYRIFRASLTIVEFSVAGGNPIVISLI